MIQKFAKILIISSFAFAFFAIGLPKAEATGFARVTAGATYTDNLGNRYGLKSTKVEVYSGQSNDYKWESSSGNCYGCRTGSVIYDGKAVNKDETSVAAITTIFTGGWGNAFDSDRDGDGKADFQFACGNSKCDSGTDLGDCNPFVVKMTVPTSGAYNGGTWTSYEARTYDPGSYGGNAVNIRKESMSQNVNLSNDSRTFVRFDYRLNFAPTIAAVSPVEDSIPEANAGTLDLVAKAADRDKDQVKVYFRLDKYDANTKQYAKLKEQDWSAFQASGSTFTFKDPLASVTNKAGGYRWVALAEDTYGFNSRQTVDYFTITANSGPTASCVSPNGSEQASGNLALNGRGSDPENNNIRLRARWALENGTWTTGSWSSYGTNNQDRLIQNITALSGQAYNWQVQADDELNDPGAWSNICNFTVAGAPDPDPEVGCDFTAEPTSGVVPLMVSFEVTNPDAGVSYTWNFGDGTGGQGADVSHTYTTNNRFTVTLSANSTSCATRVVTVNPWSIGDQKEIAP